MSMSDCAGPYPDHLESGWQAPDGTNVCIRPIRPADRDLERAFVQRLSPETRYFRFMSGMRELDEATLDRFTRIDYARDMALVALVDEGGTQRQVGVARFVSDAGGESCEFAIVVADDWKGRGLGRHLLELLLDVARSRPFKRISGEILATNQRMLRFVRSLGFETAFSPDGPSVVRATLRL